MALDDVAQKQGVQHGAQVGHRELFFQRQVVDAGQAPELQVLVEQKAGVESGHRLGADSDVFGKAQGVHRNLDIANKSDISCHYLRIVAITAAIFIRSTSKHIHSGQAPAAGRKDGSGRQPSVDSRGNSRSEGKSWIPMGSLRIGHAAKDISRSTRK